MADFIIHSLGLFDRFEEWFNRKFGWFFTNGRKHPYGKGGWYFRVSRKHSSVL